MGSKSKTRLYYAGVSGMVNGMCSRTRNVYYIGASSEKKALKYLKEQKDKTSKYHIHDITERMGKGYKKLKEGEVVQSIDYRIGKEKVRTEIYETKTIRGKKKKEVLMKGEDRVAEQKVIYIDLDVSIYDGWELNLKKLEELYGVNIRGKNDDVTRLVIVTSSYSEEGLVDIKRMLNNQGQRKLSNKIIGLTQMKYDEEDSERAKDRWEAEQKKKGLKITEQIIGGVK